MEIPILTAEDLDKFRVQLLNDIENLLNKKQPKKWLRTPDVMVLLGISEMTVQTLRNRGQIPYRKLGGTCYYNEEEINQYLKDLKY